LIQLEALNTVLLKTDLGFYRRVARWYSTTFHTPLHLVNTIPWEELLTHYYESHYEQMPYNELIRLAKDTLPELAKEEEEANEEFIKALLEADSLKKQSLKKPASVKPPEPPTNTPEVFKTFDVEDEE
jgi:hypothetical protein